MWIFPTIVTVNKAPERADYIIFEQTTAFARVFIYTYNGAVVSFIYELISHSAGLVRISSHKQV